MSMLYKGILAETRCPSPGFRAELEEREWFRRIEKGFFIWIC